MKQKKPGKERRIKNFKKSKFFGFVKGISRIFLRRSKLIYDGAELPEQAIFLTTHSVNPLLGILKNEISMPKEVKFVTLGTHELCNPYFKRLMYGCNMHYRTQLGWGPVRAFLWSALVAVFLGPLYKMARVIPSYRDARSRKTMKEALRAMEQGYSVMLYPENIEHMYNSVYLEFLPGFVTLAKLFYKKTGKDVPVIPCYFSYQLNRFVIGSPVSAVGMLNAGRTKEEIAGVFKDEANGLFKTHIMPIVQKRGAKYAAYNKV